MIKEALTQSYISLISLLIGVVAIVILLNQFGSLGIEIFSLDNRQPNDYMKREHNLLMLLLFGVIGFGGVGYGIAGIHKAVNLLKGHTQSNQNK